MRERNSSLGRRFILAALAVTAGIASGASLVLASQADPTLQGRVLQRSDGYLFVYKDGTRYPVGVTAMSDDNIEALPLGAPVDRVDQLFAPAAVASDAPAEQSDNAALSQPGTLLYQADWSNGPGGWALPADWQVSNGTISTTRTDQPSDIVAPYQPPSLDYAVEAQIQVTKFASPPVLNNVGFGLISRGDARYEYHGGMADAGRTAVITAPSGTLAARSFTAGTGWHRYRFEAKGNRVRLIIDGVSWADSEPNPIFSMMTPNGHIVGLWAYAALVNVRDFKVFAL